MQSLKPELVLDVFFLPASSNTNWSSHTLALKENTRSSAKKNLTAGSLPQTTNSVLYLISEFSALEHVLTLRLRPKNDLVVDQLQNLLKSLRQKLAFFSNKRTWEENQIELEQLSHEQILLFRSILNLSQNSAGTFVTSSKLVGRNSVVKSHLIQQKKLNSSSSFKLMWWHLDSVSDSDSCDSESLIPMISDVPLQRR
jgi:hypothetical protein